MAPVKIGNAQGFWGDSPDAPARLVAQSPDLDYLTLDYLAEVSLSIMAIQREKVPTAGYARDFIGVVKSLTPMWKAGSKVKVICNAGGLNPAACGDACMAALRDVGCFDKKVGIVYGDDVLPLLTASRQVTDFANLETGEPLATVADRLVTANAYVGAEPVVRALELGADIVVTGRVADPSLTVAACVFHHGWKFDDWRRIAGATVAGHLIECGTQSTGGINTDWLDIPNPGDIGFPIVEVDADGNIVATKPLHTGGAVTPRIIKEQLLYEIGDPGNYLSPDATVSFLGLTVEQVGADRVAVRGAIGSPPPATLKVSATFRDGYFAQALLTIFGKEAPTKAQRAGEAILRKLENAGHRYRQSNIECLGIGAAVPGVLGNKANTTCIETVLRIAVSDPDRAAVERFTEEIAPLVTSGPQGITGYATGRASVRPIFGYWPCLVERHAVRSEVAIIQPT